MSKHTPGPWKVQEYSDVENGEDVHTIGISFRRLDMTPQPCAGRFIGFGDRLEGRCKKELEEVRANARLIAAAPEMLVALKMIESCLNPEDNDVAARSVRAAIAKAEGK